MPWHSPTTGTPVTLRIAQQLAVAADVLDPETWTGRTAQRQRRMIRQRLGFHPASVTDIQALVLWLTQQPLMGHDHDLAALKALAYQRLYQLRIEPPTPDRLDRAVRSAIHRFEHDLFESIYRAMPTSTLRALDRLVRTEATDDDDDRTFHHSRFLKLKRDPMQMSLRAVMEEVEKLAWLQAVELPSDLLAHLTPKLIRKYRQRAAAEPPRELRSHPNPIKYTLLAAFCWQRRREVTDRSSWRLFASPPS